jgi:hypothetical protein
MKKIGLIFALIIFLSVFAQASIANIDDTIKFNLFHDGLIPTIITKADIQLCDNSDCSSVYRTKEYSAKETLACYLMHTKYSMNGNTENSTAKE